MKSEVNRLPRDLRERTTDFALRIVRMYSALPKSTEAQVLGKQVLRSGTSVGAHYREASRARSKKEFVSKLEGALAELDETDYWLELLVKSEIVDADRLRSLRDETNELLRILTTSIRTAKDNAKENAKVRSEKS
ncbi:MAG: four helix bundle protein [Candidatus Hydrogenedentes bacterium]|nr:four helix bundle protein [Candidatus Hydrogenedentota bacterium]